MGRHHFQGRLASNSMDVLRWGIENFQPIPNAEFPELSTEIVEDLRNDQFHAHNICQAVISCVVDEDLRQLQVGGLCHSRWLTLGCCILRLYVSKCNPSNSLQVLANYLVNVYFPCWIVGFISSKTTS